MSKKHYILMADVIDSRSHHSTNLMRRFDRIIRETNESHKSSIISPLTITLGDEFQGVCANLRESIRVILHLEKETLFSDKCIELRYVLHYGEISGPLNQDTSYGMLGRGLTMSRKLLEDKRRGQPRFKILISDSIYGSILQNAFLVLNDLEKNSWRIRRNHKILIDFLFGRLSDSEIADRHDKTRSEIWKFRNNWNIDSGIGILNILEDIE